MAKGLKEAYTALEASSVQMGLTINANRTKFIITNNNGNTTNLQINNYEFEKVNEFVYRRVYVNSKKIETTILSANRSYFGLNTHFRSKIIITKETKMARYERPILIFSTESRVLKKEDEQNWAVFERKILRR